MQTEAIKQLNSLLEGEISATETYWSMRISCRRNSARTPL